MGPSQMGPSLSAKFTSCLLVFSGLVVQELKNTVPMGALRGPPIGGAAEGGASVFFVSCIASPLKTNKKEVNFVDRLGPI